MAYTRKKEPNMSRGRREQVLKQRWKYSNKYRSSTKRNCKEDIKGVRRGA
jgi:hypothetical protein